MGEWRTRSLNPWNLVTLNQCQSDEDAICIAILAEVSESNGGETELEESEIGEAELLRG